jgi:hypothetical protein
MPAEHRVDPTLLDPVIGALTRSSAAALETSHELLAHYSDTGDAPTQRAVDTLIEHAADALRALTDSFADISCGLQAAPVQAATVRASTSEAATLRAAAFRAAEADGASVRPGRGHDH